MDAVQLLAEPRRRAILRMLWDRELPAGEIAAAFPVSFSAVSQHLAALRAAGLVSVRTDGRRRMYRVDRDALRPFAELLRSMWRTDLDSLAAAAEAAEATGEGVAR